MIPVMLHTMDNITTKKEIIENIIINVPKKVFQVSGCWDKQENIWDRKLIEFANSLLNEGDTFFDIGSNTGSFSFLNHNKNLKIHCFEPYSVVFDLLQETVDLNEFKGTHTLNQFGMSSHKSQVELKIPKYDGTGGSTISERPLRFDEYITENINLNTIDDYVRENDIEKVDLIKIDTEGHELFVLQGGIETLKKFKPKVIMEHHPFNMKQTNTNPEDIIKLLKDIGYQNIEKVTFEDLYAY
jgi:FkbM family methyltransferase